MMDLVCIRILVDHIYLFGFLNYMYIVVSQETHYLPCSFAHMSTQKKTIRIESPPSVKYIHVCAWEQC